MRRLLPQPGGPQLRRLPNVRLHRGKERVLPQAAPTECRTAKSGRRLPHG